MKRFFDFLKQMLSTKKGRYILGAGVLVLVLLGIMAAGSGKERVPSARKLAKLNEKNIDKIFNKTVRDFRGHLIDKLDEQKDTNFVVYAEGVQRIEVSEKKNTIISANPQQKIYVFGKPSKEIRKLEPGDIFFVDPSIECPTGIVVKVREITIENRQATIISDNVELEELIEYADINMDFAVSQVYFEEDGEPYTAQFEEYTNNEQEIWDNEEVSGEAVMEAFAAGTGDKARAKSGKDNGLVQGSKFSWLKNTVYDETIPICLNVSKQITGNIEGLVAKGTVGTKISGIHVVFRMYPLYATLESSVSVLARPYVDGTLGIGGTWQQAFGLPKMFVPVFGPFCIGYYVTPSISVSGSVNGRLSMAADVEVGAGSKIIAGGIVQQPYFIFEGPENYAAKLNLVEAEADIDLNLLEVRVGFGVPEVTEIYASVSGGLAVDGRMEFPEMTFVSENAENMHDCDACVDGDIGVEVRSNVGWTGLVQFKKFFPKESFRAGVEHKIFEENIPLKDFYISYRNNDYTGEKKIECALGTCPYKGIPVIVKMNSTMEREDIPLDDFVVKVDDGKFIREFTTTDENGEAHFLLPEGEYKLTVDHGFFNYTNKINVTDVKLVEEVEVDITPQIFVLAYTVEEEFLSTAPISEIVGSHSYTLINLGQKYDAEKAETELLLAGAKPGDIVIQVGWDQTRGGVYEAGQRWEFTQYLLGHTTIGIGRVLYTYGAVDVAGKEVSPNITLRWWLISYNNFANGNGLVHMQSLKKEKYDEAPEFDDFRLRSNVSLDYGDIPYDAAYAIRSPQTRGSSYEESLSLGRQTFWTCYNSLSSFMPRLHEVAGKYNVYLEAALNNQDFTDMPPVFWD